MLLIPDRKGEHAVDVPRQVRAPLAVAVEQHLGVAVVGAEAVAAAFEFFAQLAVVVDLAVENQMQRAG